jgi:hypothetical protein
MSQLQSKDVLRMFFLTLSAKALNVFSRANRYNHSIFQAKRTYDGFLRHHTRLVIDYHSDDAPYCEMDVSYGAGFRLPNGARHGIQYEWEDEHYHIRLNAIPKVQLISRYYNGHKQGLQEEFEDSSLVNVSFYQNGSRTGYSIGYSWRQGDYVFGKFVRYLNNNQPCIVIPWKSSPAEVIQVIEDLKESHPKLFQY